MKINWGTKLVFFAACFMVFVVSMVIVISRQDVPLVDENYYEKGLNYQKEIDNNAASDTTITLSFGEAQMKPNKFSKVIIIEKSSPGDISEAIIQYYRPSNPKMDQKIKTQILSGKQLMHSVEDLAAGKWKAVLTWKLGEKEYKIEKEFDR